MPALARAKELRAKRASLWEQMKQLVDTAKKEGRSLTDEERVQFDKIDAEIETIKAEVEKIEADEEADAKRQERAKALEAEMRSSRGVVAGKEDTPPAGKEQRAEGPNAEERKKAESRAFEKWVRYGNGALTAEDRAVMVPRSLEAAALPPELRAQGVSVDTAGGYAVPDAPMAMIVDAMLNYGGMRRSRAFVFTTDSGADLPIPTDNDTSNSGAILSENTIVTAQDVTFGAVVMHSYMYTSKLVLVSLQLLRDSGFPIIPWLSGKLGTRIGRATNTHFTTGDGAAKPIGVVTGATLGVSGSTGSTTSVTADNLIALIHSVDPDYRTGAQWMMRDATIRAIKQLKDGNGQYLWAPGLANREGDQLLGFPYIVNQDVATMAASAKSILFGDFSLYYIRDVAGMTVLRLTERYADYLQVGFLAFSAHDGALVDAGTHPVKYYQNSAT